MSRVSHVGVAALVSLALLLVADPSALANGSKGKRVVYRGTLPVADGPGEVQLDAEVEPLLFRLATVGATYRVVRIRIRNTGTRPLVLSAGRDAVEVELRGGTRLAGVLDLGARDPVVWEALPADLRSLVVYPQRVEGGEEESVFVLLPASGTAEIPHVFRYTFGSRPDRPVVIRDVSAAVAH
jgi:hypothetical protein